jgi:glycosyltransferase involved in cell wall biosynthesis
MTVLRHLPDPYRVARLMLAARTRLRTRHLTAVSPYLASRWRREMRYRRSIEVIPNISPFPPQRDHVRPQGVRLIDLADGSRRKNVRTLLEAFALVRSSLPNAELTLLGGGLAKDDDLASDAHSDGLGHGVRFLGHLGREQVALELSRATMLVHGSLEESQPMSLIEGLAWGLPVLAGRDAGGCAWTLDDGRVGTLVDVTDPRAIADAVVAEASKNRFDPEPGWRLLESRYSAAAVTDAYERVYDSTMRAHDG